MEQILGGVAPDPAAAAARLIREFGSAPAALAGSPSRIRRLGFDDGVTQRLQAVQHSLRMITGKRIERRPVLRSYGALSNYLQVRLRFETIEHLLALFVDQRRHLIGERVWTGTVDEVSVYVQPLFHHAFDLGASGLVLVHNHPAGDPSPSAADKAITVKVATAGKALGVPLLDHLIVARDGTFSFREAGYL